MRAGLALAAATSLLGCAALAGLPRPIPECPGVLVTTDAMGGDFRLRQQVRVRGERSEAGFTLVAEKRGGRLVLVALDRFGAKAFAVGQESATVRVERAPHPGFPVPPVNVLRDFQRMRFLGEGEPMPSGAWRVRPSGCRHETLFVTLSEELL
jgi:hypothetical protein